MSAFSSSFFASLNERYIQPFILFLTKHAWSKFIIGGLLGSSILAVVNEFGAYWYAISYGVRPPLEGIPFLRVAIVLGGFVTYGIVVLIFLLLVLVARWIFSTADETRKDKKLLIPDEPNSGLPKYKMLHIVGGDVLFRLALSSFIVTMLLLFFNLGEPLASDNFLTGVLIFYIFLFVLLAVFGKIISSSSYYVPVTAFVSSVLFFSVFCCSILNSSNYAGLLRILGYGGGTYVHVFHDGGEYARRSSIEGYLVLRSSSALTLYVPQSTAENKLLEFPISEAIISYSSTKIQKPNQLPERKPINPLSIMFPWRWNRF